MRTVDLIDMQHRAADALLSAENLLSSAEQLARALREMAEDDVRWDKFGAAAAQFVNRQHVPLVISLDWPAILEEVGYRQPPPGSTVSSELAGCASSMGEPPPWPALRERLMWLSLKLSQDLAVPTGSRGQIWWSRVKERVGFGWDAVRRINLAAVLGEEAIAGFEMAPWIAAFVPVPPAAAFGLAGGIVLALLRKTYSELGLVQVERDVVRLQAIADSPTLRPAEIGRQLSELKKVNDYVDVSDRTGWPLDLTEDLTQIRTWAATVGSDLAVAWGFVAAYGGAAGLGRLNAVANGLSDLRRALARIDDAVRDCSVADVRVWGESASTVVEALMGRIQEFLVFLRENTPVV
jgi:hypothetical protein